MGLLDVLGASRTVCAGVAGIATAYRTHPGREVAPEKIPATLQEPGPVAIDWQTSLDRRDYEFSVHIFCHREGDLVDEEEEVIALAEAVADAFKSQTQHDPAYNIREMVPTAMSKPFPWSINEAKYTVVTLTMSAKTKAAADFS